MTLLPVDYIILAVYFAFVIGIGWYLKRSISTSSDFLTSGRSVPVWITSLAFVAANLGAQELIGMCASGAKYGIMTAHCPFSSMRAFNAGVVPAVIVIASDNDGIV